MENTEIKVDTVAFKIHPSVKPLLPMKPDPIAKAMRNKDSQIFKAFARSEHDEMMKLIKEEK